MVGVFRFEPCPDCCDGCWNFTDPFTGSDSSTIGGAWIEDEGGWERQSNTLVPTGTGVNRIHNQEQHGLDPYSQQVHAHVRFNLATIAAGDTFRLMMLYDESAETYLALEVEFVRITGHPSGLYIDVTCRCLNTSGTVLASRDLTDVFVGSQFWPFSVYHTGRDKYCANAFGTTSLFTVQISPPAGRMSGLYVNQASSGAFTFDDYMVATHGWHAPDAPCTECDCGCEGYYVPMQLSITITWTGSCPCAEGAYTYNLTHSDYPPETSPRSAGYWESDPTCATYTTAKLYCDGHDPTGWSVQYLGYTLYPTSGDDTASCNPLYMRITREYAPGCTLMIEVNE